MIMFGSFLPSLGWLAPPKFTRAWEPTLLWNHLEAVSVCIYAPTNRLEYSIRPRIGAASDKVIRCASVPGCLICFGEAWSDSNDSRLIDRHGNPRIFGNGTEQFHTLTGRSNHMFVDAVQSSPDASARGRLRRHQAFKVIA